MLLHRRDDFFFQVADQQAVFVLVGDKGAELVACRCDLRLVDLLRGEVRATDVTDFTLADQVIKRAQGFRDRCVGVGEMHLVKIDPVGLEPFQARLDGFRDVGGRSTAATGLLHRQAKLCRQHDVLAPHPERSP